MSVAAGISDHRGWAVVVCMGARARAPGAPEGGGRSDRRTRLPLRLPNMEDA